METDENAIMEQLPTHTWSYRLRKIKSKYIIISLFSYFGSQDEIGSYLHNINKTFRHLLWDNVQIL
jgi:hypothetical protein